MIDTTWFCGACHEARHTSFCAHCGAARPDAATTPRELPRRGEPVDIVLSIGHLLRRTVILCAPDGATWFDDNQGMHWSACEENKIPGWRHVPTSEFSPSYPPKDCAGTSDCKACWRDGFVFRCPDCGRELPWCVGCDDDYPDICNDCFTSEREREALDILNAGMESPLEWDCLDEISRKVALKRRDRAESLFKAKTDKRVKRIEEHNRKLCEGSLRIQRECQERISTAERLTMEEDFSRRATRTLEVVEVDRLVKASNTWAASVGALREEIDRLKSESERRLNGYRVAMKDRERFLNERDASIAEVERLKERVDDYRSAREELERRLHEQQAKNERLVSAAVPLVAALQEACLRSPGGGLPDSLAVARWNALLGCLEVEGLFKR